MKFKTEQRHFAADGTQVVFSNVKIVDGKITKCGYAVTDLHWSKELTITRSIDYKTANPSLHKCGAKCQNATGPSCECECGGKNHGGNH